jgi:hypothetical protein
MIYRIVWFAVLMLVMVRPASAQQLTLGHTEAGPFVSQGLVANSKRGSKFTPSEPGTVYFLCALVDGLGGATGHQRYRLALYSDNAGVPDKKLAETGLSVVSSGADPEWICSPVGYVSVTTVPYWIVMHSGSPAGVARVNFQEPANWYGASTDAFDDGASETFGSGSSGARTLTVHAEYIPASKLHHAGRFTVGSTPSSGLSANFKRGSSFTLTEPGRLSAFTTYLDGHGGSGLSQDIRFTLYRDSNGVPGTKVDESDVTGFEGGMLGRWITYGALKNRAVLEPGKYWYVLHTGAWATTLRYFTDGTPGAWYGNADNFEDGASAPFGAGNLGNGTLSGFISFEPGPFVTRQIGRTTVGTRPSSGLSANFIRGSRFAVQPRDPDMVITGLNAYLDGNGGAAGSQKVRMAIYQIFHYPGEPGPTAVRFASSSEVVINAGRAPGWVHFPIEEHAGLLDPNTEFYIMIHSGDTGGVARFYGDGAANWIGRQLVYADTTEFPLTGVTIGDTTLSVYATYTTKDD